MKRVIPFAALLLAASACTINTPPATNTTTSTGNANMAATSKSAIVSDADITAQEKKIFDALKAKDFKAFGDLLAADSIEVGGNGVHDKAASLKDVEQLNLTDYNLSDWKVTKLGPDAAVVTYSATAKGDMGGKPFPADAVRASTAWVNRDGKWLAVYHQETPVAKTPAGAAAKASPSPAASTAAKPAASSSPVAATTSDTIANEKLIWEMLKKKDIDGFASMLADDALEVESDGVYNKAGTVKGVQSANLAGIAVSDFKTQKLGTDSQLVTYVTTTGTGDKAMRSYDSTIWANRGGKWLAVFHQATEAGKSGAANVETAKPTPAKK
jgi:hypothetical protein